MSVIHEGYLPDFMHHALKSNSVHFREITFSSVKVILIIP